MQLLLEDGFATQVSDIPDLHCPLLITTAQPTTPWIDIEQQSLICLPFATEFGHRRGYVSQIVDLYRR